MLEKGMYVRCPMDQLEDSRSFVCGQLKEINQFTETAKVEFKDPFGFKNYYEKLDDTHTIELDVFDAPFAPLYMAEVEFATLEEAENFTPPEWFGEDVTFDGSYHNSAMSKGAHLKN